MLATLDEVLLLTANVYAPQPIPKDFSLAAAAQKAKAGGAIDDLAGQVGVSPRRLKLLVGQDDPLNAVFKTTLREAAAEERLRKARRSLGQMLVGALAERVFEQIYMETMGTSELRLEDFRPSRTETDFRVKNGLDRPVIRINIKFHGTRFQKAKDLVGLDSEDCFALATYKIYQAIKKQEQERLAYVFVVVSVGALAGERVGKALPDNLVHLLSFVLSAKKVEVRKRDFEDQIVLHLIQHEQPPEVRTTVQEFGALIGAAEWRVISARKADNLLREKLFDRVYAVKVPRFARNYPGAEVDMHLSLSQDLTALPEFLRLAAEHGLHGLSLRLERGEI